MHFRGVGGVTGFVAGAIALSACGSDDRPPSTTGIEPDKPLADLTDSEIRQLCDWTVAQLGGYGRSSECAGGLQIRTFASQEECAARHRQDVLQPSCTATVADAEACITALDGDHCQVLSAPECGPLSECTAASD
jgi:hypothetical protein